MFDALRGLNCALLAKWQRANCGGVDDLEASLVRSLAFGGVHRFVCVLDAIFPVEIARLERDDSETERE